MTNSLPVLVCFAVKEEAAHFRRFADGDLRVGVLVTGMGRRNAERALADSISKCRPGLVVSSGFAGALIPELDRHAVVFAADKDSGLEAPLCAAGARPVRFHCSEQVVTTAAEKRALHQTTGAEAVEMES